MVGFTIEMNTHIDKLRYPRMNLMEGPQSKHLII